MKTIRVRAWLVSVGSVLLIACASNSPTEMTFFVTSIAAGDGGNLGGLAGADAHCQRLAETAGSRNRHWRAYLSAAGEDGQPAVHARDRFGNGPWVNVRGVQIAASVADLHGDGNTLARRTSLNERGQPTPHDILTGSNPDGTLAVDETCRNWTSTQGQGMVGHSDKDGSCCDGRQRSWNSAHLTENCTASGVRALGGAGLLYCFATE